LETPEDHICPNNTLQINSIEELKRESLKRSEFFILLNFGIKSTKYITYNPKLNEFHINHSIDDTDETVAERDLAEYTNIPKAIEKHAFYKVI